MQRLKPKRLIWIMVLALKKIVESVLTVIALCYVVFVFDIYVNTEKLSKVNNSLNAFCQNVANNPNFTKGPVIFRVDRGTLVYHLNFYVSEEDLYGYSPFFIFPHHRTVILAEEALKMDKWTMAELVAHELGHIQGGLRHFGVAKEMERYADDFAARVVKTQPQKGP